MLLRLIPALLAAAVLCAAGTYVSASARDAGAGTPVLPDLDQETPDALVVVREGTEYRLGFRSAVRNVGAGPLIIDGRRPSVDHREMVADQVVVRRGAPRSRVRDVGRLRYVVSPDHRHWHLLGFERYELRRPGASVALVRDRKTGFCLGDRYPVAGLTPPAPPRYTSRCGLGEPARLSITEGIAVGYGDDYAANLEGQYLPLTGLRDGRYVLVHQVNADRRLRERRYDNDAAALLLRLRWQHGVPRLKVLGTCPGSATCGA